MGPSLCPRHQRPATQSARSVRRAICTLLPLVFTIILPPPIAFSSPPDSSWIAGPYGGADGDGIVTLLYETAAVTTPSLSEGVTLTCLPGVSFEGILRSIFVARSAREPRAPPVLNSATFAHISESLSALPFPVSPATSPSVSPFGPLKVTLDWTESFSNIRRSLSS